VLGDTGTSSLGTFQLYVNGDVYTENFQYECMLKDIDKGIYKCNFEFQNDLNNFMYVLKVKANTFKHFAIVTTKLTAANRKMKSLNETVSKDFNLKDSADAEENKEDLQTMEYKIELELVEEKPMTFLEIDAFNELRVNVTTKPYLLDGYSGEIGCTMPITKNQLLIAKESIIEKTTEEAKLIVAKQIINSNCFFVFQIKEMMMLFLNEQAKLEIAKASYFKIYDVGNYYQLNDVLKEEASIKELNDFINTQ
jgi:hypothetical protein